MAACDTCVNSRPVVSENGIHWVCCLSGMAAQKCLTGSKNMFVDFETLIAEIKEETDRGGGDSK